VQDHASDRNAAARLRERFPWVSFDPLQANPGFAAGVNRAARRARGAYLLLLNPDCVLRGNVPQVLSSWLDGQPDVGACGCLVRDADGNVQASARWFPGFSTAVAGRTSWLSRTWPQNWLTRRNLIAPEPSMRAVHVDWVSGVCVMLRRDAFRQVDGMDEGFFLYWEDADLCVRLKRRGWRTAYVPHVEIVHLTGRCTAHARARSVLAFHRSAFRYFRKHGGRWALAAAPAVYVALHVRALLKLMADLPDQSARARAADMP
jgi:GT2 family glycosyltransferase